MRRKDREVVDVEKIRKILVKTEILHLGLNDDKYPYVVPLHYGYEISDGQLIFYMHCAQEGHKLDLIKKNAFACVQIDNDAALVSGGDVACEYGSTYSSVIARGRIELLENPAEKIHGLKILMKHQTGQEFSVNEKAADSVGVLKFVSDSYSAKARKLSDAGI